MVSPDEKSMLSHLYEGIRAQPTKDRTDLSFSGKNVIVTGANTGLGLAAAIKFAEQGTSRLILAVRNLEKGNIAKNTIIEASKAKNPTCNIEVWQLDMLSYPSIHSFVAQVNKDLDHIDVAILNAGIAATEYINSEHGWESVFQVNTLSTVLLALLLLPKLKASRSASRIPVLEFVGSTSHWMTKLSKDRISAPNILEAFNGPVGFEDGIQGSEQYGRSKLFLQAAVQYLGEHVGTAQDGKPLVYIWSMCPGVVKTEIGRNAKGLLVGLALRIITTTLAKTPEQGSRGIISGTALGAEAQGGFYRDEKIHEYVLMLKLREAC
jgi:NAD(P)-dependent dehydrogenase (short-subunit alcohol dehydrogenase family)